MSWRAAIRQNAKMLTDSSWWLTVSTVITLYGLFGGDIRVLSFTSLADATFDVLTISAMVFFAIEIILTCISERGYLLSFFFILDVIFTATLVLDVSSISGSIDSGDVSNASRASRAGTRASRIIRVLRLVRLLQISRLFNALMRKRQATYAKNDDQKQDEFANMPENHMGAELSKLTSQRVIIVVLLIVLVIPQFSVSSYFNTVPDLHDAGRLAISLAYNNFVKQCRMGDIDKISSTRLIYENTLMLYVSSGTLEVKDSPRLGWIGAEITNASDTCLTRENSPMPHLQGLLRNRTGLEMQLQKPWNLSCDPSFLTTSGVSFLGDVECSSELRSSEKTKLTAIYPDFTFEIVVDMREYLRSEALLSIYRTLVICLILGIVTLVFSENAFKLVLDPIDRMMVKVDKLRENPLHASKMDDDTVKREEVERVRCIARYNTATSFIERWKAKRDLVHMNRGTLETDMLEKTIVRISGLLALGFGQAGAHIVAHNMKSTDPSINVMIPGKKVNAVFVSIRVKHFPIISAVLKDKIVPFMNQLAEIIHGITDEFNGMPNKSDSGSFLMVWRLTDDEQKNLQIHEMAVAACIKITIAIGRSLELHEYRSLPPLIQKFPGFRVQLNFGLHRGWAIEGAIGSDLKIDASYLGPDINLVEALAALNVKYRTCILASNHMVESCNSAFAKALFRRIDRIRLANNRSDLHIFSLDLDSQAELLATYEVEHAVQSTSMDTNRRRQVREREKRKESRWTSDILLFLSKDKYFKILREAYESDPVVQGLFNKGFLNYEAAEWDVAIEAFEQRQTILWDEPAQLLIDFMISYDCLPPQGWTGHRICEKLL